MASSPGPLIEIIIYVQDMDRAVRFYRVSLGLQVKFPTGLSDYTEQMWVTFDTGACTLALHGGGGGRPGQYTSEIVFAVQDIQKVRAALVENGVEMGEVRPLEGGGAVCSGQDPDGHPFAIESMKGSN